MYLKLFQQLLTITIFLAIFVSLMASATGSVFRYHLIYIIFTTEMTLELIIRFWIYRIQLGNQVEVDPEDIHVTFDDVKGADDAKQELKEVVCIKNIY